MCSAAAIIGTPLMRRREYSGSDAGSRMGAIRTGGNERRPHGAAGGAASNPLTQFLPAEFALDEGADHWPVVHDQHLAGTGCHDAAPSHGPDPQGHWKAPTTPDNGMKSEAVKLQPSQ